ncbi:sorbose reductase [Lachnospiraceae bacterium PM6-15]|uniref:SDR family oxidoreductase n=1 Tax=Ohessyouella blattaphilus TaxID=2949333 RepID=UPI003E2DB7B0
MFVEEMFGLTGKVAVVTGGGRGIGQVVAIGLAKAGAEVVIFARSDASNTVELIENEGGKAYQVRVDVTKEEEVDLAVKETVKRSGKIDIVFNNAGICIHKGTVEASIAEWKEVLNTNLTGIYIVARSIGRYMIENKIKGSIINMGSMSGGIVNIPQWQASYNASKAGVIHLSKSLAVEWVDYGIRVNCLSPGYIGTPMSADTPQELKDAWMPLIPAHRMGTPEELIGAVIYLASDSSGYTNGCDLIVDGAYTCV